MNLNDCIGDLMNEIGEVTDKCNSVIGQEQLAQIHSLKVEVESLKNQLKEKEEHISLLERSHINHNLVGEVEKTINSIIQEQITKLESQKNSNGSKSSSNSDIKQEYLKRLRDISNMSDIRDKIISLFEFVSDLNKCDLKNQKISENKLSSMRNRILACLQGHVEFLTRLAESPELQSLFLVSSHSGQTFLSETTCRLLSEQAARTSDFIYSERKRNKNRNSQDDEIGSLFSVNQILDLEKIPNFDAQNRTNKITSLLSKQATEIKADELKELLIQEVSISSILRRYCESLNKMNAEYQSGFDNILQIFNKKRNPATPIRKIIKEIEYEFNTLKEELKKKDEILQNTSHSIKSQNKAIENNESAIRGLKEAVNSSENKSKKLEQRLREIESQFNQTNEENQKLKSYVHQLQKSQNQAKLQVEDKDKQLKMLQSQIHSQKKKMDLAVSQNENSSATKSLRKWDKWGQRLYYALTGNQPDGFDNDSIRTAIEESALTAVGNPKVQAFFSQQTKSKNAKW